MVNYAIAIALGSMLAFYGSDIPDPFWISYLPALLLSAWSTPRYRFLILIVLAYLWTSLHLLFALESRLAPDFNNQIVQVTGIIADIPKTRSQSVRFLLKPEIIAGYPSALPQQIRLSWYRTEQLPAAGERWQLLVKLKMPDGFRNPGGFDYERWLFVKGIGATGYVRKSQSNRRLDQPGFWNIDRWRTRILKGIDRNCASCDNPGLIKALAIGYRGDIPPDYRQILQDTGTAHLLAISGLHIGMVAALFFGLGRCIWQIWFFRLFQNRIVFSASLAFSGGLMYAALAGFSLPTVRALVMLAVIFLALKFRSGINLLNSVAIAVVSILIVDPLATGSSSFWLSIGALLVIAFAQFSLAGTVSRWKQMLGIQLMFSLLFIPISIIVFDQINPASFFANILAIPLVSLVIVPIGLLASLLGSFDAGLSEWLFSASDSLLTWLSGYLSLLLDLGLGAYQGVGVPYIIIGLSSIGLIVVLLPAGGVARKPASLLLVLPLFWHRPELDFGDYRLTVLDVGTGTSVVLETRNHSLVYDFGPGNDQGYSAGLWVLKPFLRHQGIVAPDLMVISHIDRDHSGGFYSLRQSFDPARLVSGTPKEVREKFDLPQAVRSCHGYPSWRWDGVEFEFLSTAGTEALASPNNRSCVLKISGFQNTLLAGDIESEQESRLISTWPDSLSASIMLAPHHGSATSSTPGFVHLVKPDIALFSVGKGNRWGFPRNEVLEVYSDLDSEILRTDQLGAITLYSSKRGVRLEKHRSRRAKL
ncbi:MAG: DNA internalization-related competence protein ComEC/Rec2, partial [Gammaproteobacteria bacterium]